MKDYFELVWYKAGKALLWLIMAGIIATLIFLTTSCTCEAQLPTQYLYIDNDCKAELPDYRQLFDFTDNCAVRDTIQLPAPGTTLNIITNGMATVEITAVDFSNNKSHIVFDVILLDTVPPIITPKTMAIGQFDTFPLVGGNRLRATPIIIRGNGYLREIAGYHKGFTNAKLVLGLYSNKDGKPYKLKASTGEVQASKTKGWQVVPVKEEVFLYDSDTMWIAFMTDQEETNEGFNASPINRMSDVSASIGNYKSEMSEYFGESTQWKWAHDLHIRFTQSNVPVEIIAENYLQVERYINNQIQGYVDDFDWSTASIDTVFGIPKCIPIGSILTAK